MSVLLRPSLVSLVGVALMAALGGWTLADDKPAGDKPAAKKAADDKPAADKPAEEKALDLTPEQIVKDPDAAKGKKVAWPTTIVEVRVKQFVPPDFVFVVLEEDGKPSPKGNYTVDARTMRMTPEALEVYHGGKEKGKNARFKMVGEVKGAIKFKVGDKEEVMPVLINSTLSLISK